MSRQLARKVLDQFNMRPALVAARYASVPGVGSPMNVGLLADINELANADPATQDEKVTFQRVELAAAYGVVDANEKPFVFTNGKAIIPVHGMLINRYSSSWGYVTGYNFIRAQVAAAMADPEVDGIVYDVNSYGGMVAGCEETAAIVYAASAKGGGKKSLAVVDSNCYSAAYYLMCAVDSIAVTSSGGVGSIGVMMMHVDMSKMLDEIGVKMTLLFAGAHKVDGHPYAPLPDDVSADMQAELEKMYDKFVTTVSTYRPGLTEEAVRETEARCYLADDALALGLVDSVQNPPEALETFFSDADDTDDDDTEPEAVDPEDVSDDDDGTDIADDEPDPDENPRSTSQGTDLMATAPTTAPAVAPVAAAPVVDAAAVSREAAAAERARVQGIVSHAEAEGRTELAQHLAFGTDMSIEAAAAILKASPKAAPPKAPKAAPGAATSPFLAAMETSPHPNVGANGGTGEDETGGEGGGETAAQRILRAQRKAFGVKPIPGGAKSPQQLLDESRNRSVA
jgi:signal peptide peptidase SppA